MTTQCNGAKLAFHRLDSREVVGWFDGGEITSDADGILFVLLGPSVDESAMQSPRCSTSGGVAPSGASIVSNHSSRSRRTSSSSSCPSCAAT